MQDIKTSDPITVPEQPIKSVQGATMLGLLVLIYTSNFIDRTILATLGQAIKEDLQISDSQLGLLQGLAFALFYSILGIPLARLSERVNRVTLISSCLALWSLMTALCGAAQNFFQLFLIRMGVGIGEAGCTPPAHSLIADIYKPEQRATALGIYSIGIPLGVMLGAVSGGWLTDNFSWRVAMVVVGLPGILLAIVFKLMVKEPVRGAADNQPEAMLQTPPSISATFQHLFSNKAFLHITIGATLVAFVGYGTGTFSQAYFIRMFDLTYTEVGMMFGLIGGLSAGVGTFLGGFLSDWAGKKHARWYAILPGIGLLLAAPAYMYAFTRNEWLLGVWMMLLPGIFHYAYIGPTLGVMHNTATARMRATATALFFFAVNLIGLGLGPWVTGLVIDAFTQWQFSASGAVNFIDSCPGGIAAADASASMQQQCSSASALGTRYGIVAMLFVFVWAAGHYFIAARFLKKSVTEGSSN
ncbi:spinster family MFS transporter [Thalassotalea mangrovi]|uniref:MFS transporter n=1 Tax=Thalassotalea mangrovi TaxID=2572245 RepID=A0A4U1B4M1_9GAMM|nr:MFS transporter [Thalassotalea mangrovi]TKB45313.1 MFS transporter [Thalassotalea mangrovi]